MRTSPRDGKDFSFTLLPISEDTTKFTDKKHAMSLASDTNGRCVDGTCAARRKSWCGGEEAGPAVLRQPPGSPASSSTPDEALRLDGTAL